MALDDAQRRVVRSYTGSADPSDDALDAIYDELGSVHATALQVLRGRYADLLTSPARFAADGDYSEEWGENIKALRSQIDELAGLCAAEVGSGPGVVSVGYMVREGRGR